MAYPSLPISYESQQAALDDLKADRASNGALRGRAFYTAPKMRFQLRHPALDSADLATFKAFYAANRTATFDYTYAGDGLTYTVAFVGSPGYVPVPVGRTNVSVVLEEV